MDATSVIARARSTLLTPKAEWPTIAAEADTVSHLYSHYIVVLAAIPAVVQFLRFSVLGIGTPFLGTYRVGVLSGLSSAVLTYAFTLIGVYVVALIVDTLAPTFHGQRDRVQALKTVAYAYTASWVASILGIVPGLGLLATLAGLGYGIYLLRLGLPVTMKCPESSAVGYTVATIVCAIVVGIVMSVLTGAIIGGPLGLAGNRAAYTSHTSGGFASGTPGAALQDWAKHVEAASQQVTTAQQSGDSTAKANAAAQMMQAALGGGSAKVEALPPERIKQFLPESLAGLKRTESAAERNGAIGMQVSKATASYSDGAARRLELEITDTASLRGLVGLATGWAGVEQDRQTDSGFEKTYRQNGQLIHEKWDNQSHRGEYGLMIADRFSVSVSGEAANIGDLKSALGSVDLAGLSSLREAGVQAN